MKRLFPVLGLIVVSFVVSARLPAHAQQELPLAPTPPRGLTVSPFFEGWYQNTDGTYTLSFGYFNRNTQETPEIPVGPDNFIVPERFDGSQPTAFPPRRERGVFSVTIPADMADQDVVWTLRHRGQTFAVPGRVKSDAYQLSYQPMAAGSIPPELRFSQNGPSGRGIVGLMAERVASARVGVPVEIQLWVDDSGSERDPVGLEAAWFKYSGPAGAAITFEPQSEANITDGMTATTATFVAPGEYVIRARVDNFSANDSGAGDQCCWSNGYVRVVVTQ